MRRFWNAVTYPWFSKVLQQQHLCRGLVVAALVLGLVSMAGYSLIPCMFSKMTGLPCPGCGVTRATVCLLRGDVPSALAYHPLIPGLVFMGGWVVLAAVLPVGGRNALVRGIAWLERRTAIFTVFVGIFLIFGWLRMSGVFSSEKVMPDSPARVLFQRRGGMSASSQE